MHLMGVQLDIAANNSIAKSYIYLNLSHALIQNGFPEEALSFINKSLDYDPENYFAPCLKTLISICQERDIEQTKKLLDAGMEKGYNPLGYFAGRSEISFFPGRL